MTAIVSGWISQTENNNIDYSIKPFRVALAHAARWYTNQNFKTSSVSQSGSNRHIEDISIDNDVKQDSWWLFQLLEATQMKISMLSQATRSYSDEIFKASPVSWSNWTKQLEQFNRHDKKFQTLYTLSKIILQFVILHYSKGLFLLRLLADTWANVIKSLLDYFINSYKAVLAQDARTWHGTKYNNIGRVWERDKQRHWKTSRWLPAVFPKSDKIHPCFILQAETMLAA